MPVTSFSLVPNFSAQVRRPPVRQLGEEVCTIIAGRLERAIRSGRIDLPKAALFLAIVLCEESPELDDPDEPTDTPPGSEERIEVYAERMERGEELYHPKDADPTHLDGHGRLIDAAPRGLRIVQRGNGTGPQVVGWDDDEEED